MMMIHSRSTVPRYERPGKPYRKGAPGQEKKTACIYRHSTKNESGRLEVNEFRGRLDVAGEENMLHLRGKHRRLMNGTLRKLKGD